MKQKHGVPAIISFFIPGLGQMMKGHVIKGLLFLIGSYVGLLFFILPGVIIWIWALMDAYNSNRQI